jgi:AP-4 complex subunit epsilon-1
MTNNTNVQTIVDKLIFFLKSASDYHFKKDLVNKICSLSEQFSPTQEWFLKTMNTVFEYGAEFIDNKLLNNFLRLVSEHFSNEGSDFGEYLVNNYLETLEKPNLHDTVYKMIAWVMGEVGS